MTEPTRLSAQELRARARELPERAAVMDRTLHCVRPGDRRQALASIQRCRSLAYDLECAAQRQEAVGA